MYDTNIKPENTEEMVMVNNAYLQCMFHTITQMQVQLTLLCQEILNEKVPYWDHIVDSQKADMMPDTYKRVERLYKGIKLGYGK